MTLPSKRQPAEATAGEAQREPLDHTDSHRETKGRQAGERLRIAVAEFSPVDIDDRVIVRLVAAGVDRGTEVTWYIDNENVGRSTVGEEHFVVDLSADEAPHTIVAATAGTKPQRSSKRVIFPSAIDVDAVIAELERTDTSEQPIPDDLLAFSDEAPVDDDDDQIADLDLEALRGAAQSFEQLFAELVEHTSAVTQPANPEAVAKELGLKFVGKEPWCPEGCNDWPRLKKVDDLDKSSRKREHPLRNIKITKCKHWKWVAKHSHHYIRIWRFKIRVSCLHFKKVYTHGYDIKSVSAFASRKYKLATRPSSNSAWIRALLPTQLHPRPGGRRTNVYFVNGINKKWSKADAQRACIDDFLGTKYQVRIIHNDKTDGQMIDPAQLDHDYKWSLGTSGMMYQQRFKSHASISVFSLLHHAMDRGTDIALVGSSGGSLQTFVGIRAFALLGASQRKYLRSHVQLLHVGGLVHRSQYDWLHQHLDRYEAHVDRRDPFARTFSGELIPEIPGAAELYEGPVVSHKMMLNPVATSIVRAVKAGLAIEQETYHSIEHDYMRRSERHVEATTFD